MHGAQKLQEQGNPAPSRTDGLFTKPSVDVFYGQERADGLK